MKLYGHRNALGITAAAVLLAGCAGSQSTPTAPGTSISQHSTLAASSSGKNFRVIYDFGAAPDGNSPHSVLKYVNGTLFGTTTGGGVKDCSDGTGYYFTCGTIFGVTTGGKETLLHPFTVGDGAEPASGFIYAKGTLYGTTYHGGGPGSEGTVYGITPTGTDTVLKVFQRARLAPENPDAALVNVRGLFYGTTSRSGRRAPRVLTYGTIFTLTPSGAFHILYRFKGGSDGGFPGPLIEMNHVLYGTTRQGGVSDAGTVYSVTTAGVEQVLYSFTGGADGDHPYQGLTALNGTLYGATPGGGEPNCHSTSNGGCGVIYSMTTSGAEKVLYTFTGGADGANPNGNLVDVNGVLYGTTSGGGANNDGTIFSLTLSGTETVLHAFSNGSDGAFPEAGLIDVKNTLYGSTVGGGLKDCGYPSDPLRCGTLFALTLK